MFPTRANMSKMLGEFNHENCMFRCSLFIPKLYNYCKSLGFETGKIMPSRAFCSDESQGYPIILITKHFGIFPFNHGQTGGIVAIDRHGPHSEHGKDVVIIQASHVGYDAETHVFGVYRRLCTEHHTISSSCGKIDATLHWFMSEYKFAMSNIFLHKTDDTCFITIDNQLLNDKRSEGLILYLDKMLKKNNSEYSFYQTHSTSKTFIASENLAGLFQTVTEKRAIGNDLLPEYFHFRKEVADDKKSGSQLEMNLLPVMPWIVTAKAPLLEAAKANTQVEFDRAFRTIVKEEGYRGKRVVYIAGLHIDISPLPGQVFPTTQFVPWAAFVQRVDGSQEILEQHALFELLKNQSSVNVDQVDLEAAISLRERLDEVISVRIERPLF